VHRYLDALNSFAYAEVSDELRGNTDTQEFDDITQAYVPQAIFSPVACDLDVDGEPFELGLCLIAPAAVKQCPYLGR